MSIRSLSLERPVATVVAHGGNLTWRIYRF